jgi:spermidine synthase
MVQMPWDLIATERHADAHLELFRKEGVFMIRANGLELMNGFTHESETALGNLAAELASGDGPRILIGGLGLGYTVAALCERLGARGSITVAEFSPAVIGWFHEHIRPTVLPVVPSNLTIVADEVLTHLWEQPRYDLIVLDIDNGPEPFTRAGNAALYEREGLRVLRDRLRPGGAILLWSGFQAPDFEEDAREIGFIVARRAISNGPRPELDHHIYLLF